MIVGFTGTRTGMNDKQKHLVKIFLKMHRPSRVVHGDCIGADSDFHNICLELKIPIDIRPSNLSTRAWRHATGVLYLPKNPLERNRDIVDQSDEMFACPKEINEVLRSGTWSAIRYARRINKRLYIFYQDGSHD